MPQFKIPKKEVDLAVVLNTPVAGDATLATGLLTLKDEAGSNALKLKFADIVGWKKDAFALGTAHVVDVSYNAAALVPNNLIALSVEIPNLVPNESNALTVVKTYTFSTGDSPTATSIRDKAVAVVNADTANTGLVATSQASNVCRIAAPSAKAGRLVVKSQLTGVVITDQTPFVPSVGSAEEVGVYLLPTSSVSVTGNQYTRYTLVYRKYIRHNGVGGNKAVVDAEVFLYAEKNFATFGAFQTALDAILGGTSTAANYLGAPSL